MQRNEDDFIASIPLQSRACEPFSCTRSNCHCRVENPHSFQFHWWNLGEVEGQNYCWELNQTFYPRRKIAPRHLYGDSRGQAALATLFCTRISSFRNRIFKPLFLETSYGLSPFVLWQNIGKLIVFSFSRGFSYSYFCSLV